jgi:hypothetical protein
MPNCRLYSTTLFLFGKLILLLPSHNFETVSFFGFMGDIKMDFHAVGCGDGIKLAQDRDSWRALVNMVMNVRVP